MERIETTSQLSQYAAALNECDSKKLYRDLANVQPGELNLPVEDRTKGNRIHHNFPVRLHYIINEMERDDMQHIIGWQAHGRSFIVNHQGEFVNKVLPLWFRQSKLASFQRQLNIYGFTRISAGPDKGGYYHPMFLRSKAFLAEYIMRIKMKGSGSRRPTSILNRPNFYRLPGLPPVPLRTTSDAGANDNPVLQAASPPPSPPTVCKEGPSIVVRKPTDSTDSPPASPTMSPESLYSSLHSMLLLQQLSATTALLRLSSGASMGSPSSNLQAALTDTLRTSEDTSRALMKILQNLPTDE